MADFRERRAAWLTVAAALTLSACGGISSGTGESTRTAIRDAAAELPPRYTYLLTSTCGERALIGTYEIVVDQDRAVSGKPADADTNTYVTEFPTIRALLDAALNADAKAGIEFEADAAGLPARLSIDPEPDALDDEECYRFTAITPVTGVPGKPSPG
ncbi:hypothetical protein [Actinoplanes sp. HUAS TT8]|uniref:hypothetical protein n=1 Tax=Actinoplanes sp. HUAS TT8 TaxID=3447453 RepID=UPI003F5224CA